MNKLNIKSKSKGFTIVELLVVIVVIGILAAITIVSYNGITARANTTSAKNTASIISDRINLYLTDKSTTVYPDTYAKVIAKSDNESYQAITNIANVTSLSSSSKTTEIQYQICGYKLTAGVAGVAISAAEVAAGTITGVQVNYWDYAKNALSLEPFKMGQVDGTAGTPAVAVKCFTAS